MKNIKNLFTSRVFKYIVLFIIGSFVVLVIIRLFYYLNVQKTNDQVYRIHLTKISMKDVMGDNLPKDPGSEGDKRVEGIDSNRNGVRDDVELAIFKEYPKSAKTRAVLLQYALTLQMETNQPFLNEEVVTKVITEQGRADTCLSDALVPRKTPESGRSDDDMIKIDSYINFLEEKQLNTISRTEARQDFYKYLRSYGESTNTPCDIDLSKLPN